MKIEQREKVKGDFVDTASIPIKTQGAIYNFLGIYTICKYSWCIIQGMFFEVSDPTFSHEFRLLPPGFSAVCHGQGGR